MDKRIIDLAVFQGFRRAGTDMSDEEQIKHYRKAHKLTRAEAIMWRAELLADEVTEFFNRPKAPVRPRKPRIVE